MLAATAVLENGWKPNMTEEAAKKLCRDAIAAGIINDMGSGSNVDLAIIKPNDHCEVRVNSISHFWISCILLNQYLWVIQKYTYFNYFFQILRPYDILQPSGEKKKDYTYPKGTTAVLDTKIFDIETTVTPIVEPMEVQKQFFNMKHIHAFK